MKISADTNYILKIDDHNIFLNNTGHFIMNTPTRWYNCGAFALGKDYWYLPYNDEDEDEFYCLEEDWDKGYIESEEDFCTMRARIMVDRMVSWGDCREICSSSELKEDEYLVLFKASYDDFHYARRMDNGDWYHKMGGCDIQKITEEEVYSDEWWESLPCCYDSEIYMLAVKKRDITKERIQRKLNRKIRGRHNG